MFDSLTQISQPTLNQQANVDALTWYASLNSDYGILPPAKNGRDLAMLIARAGCGYWIDWLSRSNYGEFWEYPRRYAAAALRIQPPSTLPVWKAIRLSQNPNTQRKPGSG